MKTIVSLLAASASGALLTKNGDDVAVQISYGGKTYDLNYSFQDWLKLHGDTIFGIDELEEGNTVETYDPEEDAEFWLEVEDDWLAAADPEAPQAFDNDIAHFDCE